MECCKWAGALRGPAAGAYAVPERLTCRSILPHIEPENRGHRDMARKMQLQLVSRKLSVPFCGELDVFVSVPAVQPAPDNRNKTPLSVYVSNDGASAPMGCYVYSIPGVSRARTSQPAHH